MQSIKTTVISTLETVKDSIENRDEEVKNRAKVFAKEAEEGIEKPAELEQMKALWADAAMCSVSIVSAVCALALCVL